MSDVQSKLAERGPYRSRFNECARVTQGLKGVMACTPSWAHLAHDQKEALDMIAHEIGRILNADPDYAGSCCADAWSDIAGCALLVYDRISSGM